jgi:hypothetical protein
MLLCLKVILKYTKISPDLLVFKTVKGVKAL